MNLITFLKGIVSKIKENHYTKKETEVLVDEKIKNQIPGSIDGTSSVVTKNLLVNEDLTVNNLNIKNKVKSNVTPYEDQVFNIGSAVKAWKNLYLTRNGLKYRTNIPDPANPGRYLSICPIAIDSDGKLQIYFPEYGNQHAITISKDGILIYNPVTKQKIVSIIDGFVEIYGRQSTNSSEGQIQSFSLNTNCHRFDLGAGNGMLATCNDFVIIPDHGVFTENAVEIWRYNRIKFGGSELTHFDAERDDFVQEEVIFSYKKAGSTTDDVPDFVITKKGDVCYKGKKLEGLIASLAIPNYVKDSGDNRHLTFAYSKTVLDFNSIEWLAGWNGNELRKISKNQFICTSTNQNLNVMQKSVARKNIGINSYLDSEVIFNWGEAEKETNRYNYYLSIKNNTVGVPLLMIWLEANTTYIVEICYRSLLKSSKYGNDACVSETFVLSIPELGGSEDPLTSYSEKILNGVNLQLLYEQEVETLDDENGNEYDNYWADIYLDQTKNGTRLIGDNRIYEISKIVKIGQKF